MNHENYQQKKAHWEQNLSMFKSVWLDLIMGRNVFIFLLILSLICQSGENNISLVFLGQDKETQNNEHFLVKWKGWQLLSGLGVFGTFSNSFLLYAFYSERQLMATSVNAMICMETMYRLAYTFTIHWRTFNMVHNNGLLNYFIDRELVKYLNEKSQF